MLVQLRKSLWLLVKRRRFSSRVFLLEWKGKEKNLFCFHTQYVNGYLPGELWQIFKKPVGIKCIIQLLKMLQVIRFLILLSLEYYSDQFSTCSNQHV